MQWVTTSILKRPLRKNNQNDSSIEIDVKNFIKVLSGEVVYCQIYPQEVKEPSKKTLIPTTTTEIQESSNSSEYNKKNAEKIEGLLRKPRSVYEKNTGRKT